MQNAQRVETALISVFDKTGLVEFATGLADLKIEIFTTGKTGEVLREASNGVVHELGGRSKLPQIVAQRAGKPVDDHITPNSYNGNGSSNGNELLHFLKRIEDYTKMPESADGRVKTLHEKVFLGILTKDRSPEHGQLLDMVVVNFYPFADVVADITATESQVTENIDIGGPAMVRSAAKNYEHVIVVTNPDSYSEVLERIESGNDTLEWRRRMAIDAWNVVAEYDRAIAEYFLASVRV